MNEAITPLIIGNWKMNGKIKQLGEIVELDIILNDMNTDKCHVVICPPTTLLISAAQLNENSKIAFGGQDCHVEQSGAHTGDISAEMLKDAGAQYVIVGHSERRADCGESDEIVQGKVEAAFRADITPIICIGESENERKQGRALEVVLEQLDKSIPTDIKDIIVAYEPVWAIGTGLVPSINDINEMHNAIRVALIKRFGVNGEKTPILYGGSMKPNNAKEMLELNNVNGGLVGGASLKASDFIQIIEACQ
ncbi:MAG: triose-phosphate isomerase [Devosiaceae bacterium]|nr:triose-phosphate isomerase [Devosiaceae bacterium]